jgi:hypothetical protein
MAAPPVELQGERETGTSQPPASGVVVANNGTLSPSVLGYVRQATQGDFFQSDSRGLFPKEENATATSQAPKRGFV